MSGRRIFTVEVDLNSPQSKKYHTMYVLEDTGGGSYGGKQIKAKQAIPAGYWFGSAIFIKL